MRHVMYVSKRMSSYTAVFMEQVRTIVSALPGSSVVFLFLLLKVVIVMFLLYVILKSVKVKGGLEDIK